MTLDLFEKVEFESNINYLLIPIIMERAMFLINLNKISDKFSRHVFNNFMLKITVLNQIKISR